MSIVLVAPELAKEAIAAIGTDSDWPQYAIFVFVRPYSLLAIGKPILLHGRLFGKIVEARGSMQAGNESDEQLSATDVISGFIEWEDSETFVIRTDAGRRVPQVLESTIRSIISGINE